MQASSSKDPAISVLLPVYNAGATLTECMESILGQTCGDFEVVVVDDHSDDSSMEILGNYLDQRIRIVRNRGKGLVAALNTGLQHCRSGLVARMDADDIMRPQRLEKQKNHIDRRPEVSLVATQVCKFPEEQIRNGYREYIRWQNGCIRPDEISNQIYIESPFAHPSVMFRKKAVTGLGGYRQGDFPEDYDLWLRMHHAGHAMEKIPEVLLDWRESQNRLSRVAPNCTRDAFNRLRADHLANDDRLDNCRKKNRPLAYWGAGRKTRQRTRLLIEKGFAPDAWIDIDPKKIGNIIGSVRVEEPAWLEREQKPFVLNYVTNHGARELSRIYLERIGYRIGVDYLEVG